MEEKTNIETSMDSLYLLIKTMKNIRQKTNGLDNESVLKRYRLQAQIELLQKIVKAKSFTIVIDQYVLDNNKASLVEAIKNEETAKE